MCRPTTQSSRRGDVLVSRFWFGGPRGSSAALEPSFDHSMNLAQATSLVKNLATFWALIAVLVIAVFLFLRFDRGSPIQPETPVSTPSLEKGIIESTDLATLKKLCAFIARERDSDNAIVKRIIEDSEHALALGLGLVITAGVITSFLCFRL